MQIIQKKLIEVESDWQKELADAFTTPESLLDYLGFSSQDYQAHFSARQLFPMRVPRFFADLMQKRQWNDPLLQQVIPRQEEFLDVEGFSADPLLEQNNNTAAMLQKYKNRVLLIVKTGCAVNCRYCFRRHFPYQQNSVNKAQWLEIFRQIAEDKAVDEVILSGGDPLMAKDKQLAWMIQAIQSIPHVKRLRIHTRLPVVMPSRVTPELTTCLAKTSLQTIVVFHINHANEVSTALSQACQKLKEAGTTLLNQGVFLKNINDNATSIAALNEALFETGILPYYMYLLDKVKGASHFDIEDNKAKAIMREVLTMQSGYLVPKLMREVAGKASKTPMDLHLE
ncbi:EF-P beta-lysylation protein EpmB [Agaribacter flavus]|uniref:L-lysine 2,3-aminomutase n=1 Tax=Agaribacter flavus TaxID=1902781 RepID=A0ABV7FP24_9ALTE